MSYFNDDDEREPIRLQIGEDGVARLAPEMVEITVEQYDAVRALIEAVGKYCDDPYEFGDSKICEAYDALVKADDAR